MESHSINYNENTMFLLVKAVLFVVLMDISVHASHVFTGSCGGYLVLWSQSLCPPPNSYVEILTLRDNGINKWGLWEVIR